MSQKKFKRQISAGGIVYRPSPEGGVEVAIGRRTTQAGRHVWCLPKGWLEAGEKPEAAAVREVREETGLSAQVEDKLGTLKYTYHDPEAGADVFKIVTFYLMRYSSGDVADHDFELAEVAWMSLGEAVAALSYSSEKKIARKAEELLRAKDVTSGG